MKMYTSKQGLLLLGLLLSCGGLVHGASLSTVSVDDILRGPQQQQQTQINLHTPSISGSVDDVDFGQKPEISSPLHVAQCRANCLQNFNNRLVQDGKTVPCFNHKDCFTCWRSCELLEAFAQWSFKSTQLIPLDDKAMIGKRIKNMATICSDYPKLSLSGCQIASDFYKRVLERRISNKEVGAVDAVVATKRENLLHISSGMIQWPMEDEKLTTTSTVYVLIQQYPDLKWRQIIQTTSNSVEISKSLSTQMANKLRNVRVLVVSSNGLLAIYYPELQKPTSPSTSTTSTPTSPVPIVNRMDESYPQDEVNQPKVIEQQTDPWELKRISLIHQKSLVIAELSWNPLKEAEDEEYLITWELDGGGLKGHLVTDSTTVSLSLWPDTLYHIQVELFERDEDSSQDGPGEEEEDSTMSMPPSSTSSPKSKSLSLTVDTSEASYPVVASALLETSTTAAGMGGHKSVSEFLNVTLLLTVSCASLLVLGVLLLALSYHNVVLIQRRRNSNQHQLLKESPEDDEDSGHGGKYYEYPSSRGQSSTECSVAIISGNTLLSEGKQLALPVPHLQFQHHPMEHHTTNASNNVRDSFSNFTNALLHPSFYNLSTREETTNHHTNTNSINNIYLNSSSLQQTGCRKE